MSPWIAGTVGIGLFLTILWGGSKMLQATAYQQGKADCQIIQMQAQDAQTEKVTAHDKAIDRKTPFSANKRDAIEWLQQYTTSNSY